jgi:hypothetical protein
MNSGNCGSQDGGNNSSSPSLHRSPDTQLPIEPPGAILLVSLRCEVSALGEPEMIRVHQTEEEKRQALQATIAAVLDLLSEDDFP